MSEKKKITIVGSGYVGMSLSVLLSQKNDVTVLDIDEERVDKINNGKSTIDDADIDNFIDKKNLYLSATSDKKKAYTFADFIIVATPTNYDSKINEFDTSILDMVVRDAISINKNATIIIKSTIPIGYTKKLQEKFSSTNIIFSPEFLREGQALKDNLFPSRIVIGSDCKNAIEFGNLLKEGASKKDIKILYMSSNEAEAVKLFANSYLAMRVAFFNELDSYSLTNRLDTKKIIEGLSYDERIGDGYNNPSFGYGGYCLPKDTKQLLSEFKNIPQNIIEAIILSNQTRIDFIAGEIKKTKPQQVGFYRLVMKQGSENVRSSATIELLKKLKELGIKIIIYEPNIHDTKILNCENFTNLESFKTAASIIVANRIHSEIKDVKNKVFSRDIFGVN
jgi:UDPglucose 6-dehydrogenase